MKKEEIINIAKRVNNGECLEDIANELNIRTCYIKDLFRSVGLVKSHILGGYYNEKYRDKIKNKELEKKSSDVFNSIEDLWLKRYRGIDTDIYKDTLDEGQDFFDEPRETINIDLNSELLLELKELADDSGVPISSYIEKMLLQMLERNKTTRLSTKGRKKYIQTMVDGSCCEEFIDEVIEDLSNKDFIKFQDISFESTSKDIKIYVANYLINKGYTLDQVEYAAKDEDYNLYDDEYCSERLELHYYFIHSGECKTYEDAEKIINEQKGD